MQAHARGPGHLGTGEVRLDMNRLCVREEEGEGREGGKEEGNHQLATKGVKTPQAEL